MTTNNNSESVMVEVTEGDRKVFYCLFGFEPRDDSPADAGRLQEIARYRIEAEASKDAEIEALRAIVEAHFIDLTMRQIGDWVAAGDDTSGLMAPGGAVKQMWQGARKILDTITQKRGEG